MSSNKIDDNLYTKELEPTNAIYPKTRIFPTSVADPVTMELIRQCNMVFKFLVDSSMTLPAGIRFLRADGVDEPYA